MHPSKRKSPRFQRVFRLQTHDSPVSIKDKCLGGTSPSGHFCVFRPFLLKTYRVSGRAIVCRVGAIVCIVRVIVCRVNSAEDKLFPSSEHIFQRLVQIGISLFLDPVGYAISSLYYHHDIDTKEKAFSGRKSAEKGLKYRLPRLSLTREAFSFCIQL